MAEHPKISVITPSYNQARFIRQTIDSVLAQNYPNFEHIVMDGGSTDGTVDILRSYPHLKWTSEKDRGQSHAINKALAAATGEIIAWINSDDWYAPGAFNLVAEALREYPVVMGACEIVKGDGAPEYVTQNVERGWFDILKYWVPYSIPTQPSIFFRRELLENSRNPHGAIIDESINYCMDYDLWLRFWDRYPARRIPQVLSYYRMYEENKTGQGMTPLLPELSKVYRYYAAESDSEKQVSFLLPFTASNKAVLSTLSSIFQYSQVPSEIILCAGKDSEDTTLLSGVVTPTHIQIRLERSPGSSIDQMLHHGFAHASAPLCVVLSPGTLLQPNTIANLRELFQKDSLGGVIMDGQQNKLSLLFDHTGQLNLGALVQERYFGSPLALRRAAIHDLAGFRSLGTPSLAVRELLFRLRFKGWDVHYCPSALLTTDENLSHCEEEDEFIGVFGNYVNAQIVTGIATELSEDTFAKHRTNVGSGVAFTPDMVSMCTAILKKAPSQWYAIDYSSPGELLRLQEFYPHFAPAYYYQAKHAARQDRIGDSHRALAEFERKRAAEKETAR